jgi:hypothetical protein
VPEVAVAKNTMFAMNSLPAHHPILLTHFLIPTHHFPNCFVFVYITSIALLTITHLQNDIFAEKLRWLQNEVKSLFFVSSTI